MRQLLQRHGWNPEVIIREYAAAEQRGLVTRSRNEHGLTAIQYAEALWRDGEKKGWLRST
jgi:hypothetical protein